MVRTEHDALGTIDMPSETAYGIQTARAVENFSISGKTIADIPGFVSSIAEIKKAAAIANRQIGVLPAAIAEAITRAADEVIRAPRAQDFPVDIYHGGGGTPANMNVNEVISLRANELLTGSKGYDAVHPNTHVNMGQSTNDVIPAAMKIAVYRLLMSLEDAAATLVGTLKQKEESFRHVVKLSRTCLQDALPITLGQQLSGYRAGIERQLAEIRRVRQECLLLPLGATAVGTEFGTFPGYKDQVYAALKDVCGIAFEPESNFFDGLQNADPWISVHAALKALSVTLCKLSSDLRIMSSGPRAGLAEIELPAVQPGSSIMPGKVNPVIPEMLMQVHFRVLGNDASVTRACEGELDLNVWESLIILCVSESATLLTRSIPALGKCLAGIEPNVERCAEDARQSLAMSTVVATLFDYSIASSVAKAAAETGKSVEEVVVERKLLSPAEAADYLDPLTMTEPARFNKLFRQKLKPDG